MPKLTAEQRFVLQQHAALSEANVNDIVLRALDKYTKGFKVVAGGAQPQVLRKRIAAIRAQYGTTRPAIAV